MIFRKECKEQGCSFCDGSLTDWHNYLGSSKCVYVVCDRCREILNDILTHKEMDMENRFNHKERLELIEKLPRTHQLAFAYGVVYSMDEVGEGIIPLLQDVSMTNDAAMVFAHQNLPHYAEQREYVLKKYKILEDHRLGQDKEHLRKKLEEPIDDDYIERRREYEARRYGNTRTEREDHSEEPHSDKTLMKHTLMLCVGIFGLGVSAGLFMMVMLG